MNIYNDNSKDFFAIGQYMLFQRKKYEEIGGHIAIKERIVEDLALAKLCKEKGQRLFYTNSEKNVKCRMYPDGFRSFYQGFRKSIWTGMEIVPISKNIICFFWIIYGLLAPLFIIDSLLKQKNSLEINIYLFFYLAYMFFLYYNWHPNRKDNLFVYLFYPIGLFITVIIIITSIYDGILGKPVKWKGIEYKTQLKKKKNDSK